MAAGEARSGLLTGCKAPLAWSEPGVAAFADPLERLLRDGAVDGSCARWMPP
jgi:hypothetical protein